MCNRKLLGGHQMVPTTRTPESTLLGGHQRASYNEDTRGFPIGSLSCLVLPVPIQSKLRESCKLLDSISVQNCTSWVYVCWLCSVWVFFCPYSVVNLMGLPLPITSLTAQTSCHTRYGVHLHILESFNTLSLFMNRNSTQNESCTSHKHIPPHTHSTH